MVVRLDVKRPYPIHLMVVEIECQNSYQHQYGTSQGVQKELDSGIQFPRTAPYTDQEVHRNQHHFPEHVEQEEIFSYKDTHHTGLKQKQQHVVFFFPGLDRLERRQNGDEAQQGGQQDQQQRNAVNTHGVMNAEGRDPVM